MKALVAEKIGMTTLFQEDGVAVPVTVLRAGPCVVTFVREMGNGRTNVQLGYGTAKEKHVAKPQRGHLKDLPLARILAEFRLPKDASAPKRGDTMNVSVFAVGDEVRVTGISKGKGFQGVVKRHHFGGGPRSHGHKHNLRAPGSIGSGWPQHTPKGTRMAGRMGGERVTVKGLRIVDVVPEENLLIVRGAVPGPRGAILHVRGDA